MTNYTDGQIVSDDEIRKFADLVDAECFDARFIGLAPLLRRILAERQAAKAGVVTDEMVETAVEAFLRKTGQTHAITKLQCDLTTECMRAALIAALGEKP